MRELMEAKKKKREEWELDGLKAWQELLDDEKGRREEFHKVPYIGTNRIQLGQVEELKRYYTGDTFASLFQSVTGFDIYPGGSGRMRYRCSLHGEDKQPSGVLYLDQGRYFCYGCSKGGDIFQLLHTFSHLTFVEAVKQLTEGMIINPLTP